MSRTRLHGALVALLSICSSSPVEAQLVTPVAARGASHVRAAYVSETGAEPSVKPLELSAIGPVVGGILGGAFGLFVQSVGCESPNCKRTSAHVKGAAAGAAVGVVLGFAVEGIFSLLSRDTAPLAASATQGMRCPD